MKSVWVVEQTVDCEPGETLGICGTEMAGQRVAREFIDKQIALGEDWRKKDDNNYQRIVTLNDESGFGKREAVASEVSVYEEDLKW